MAKLKLYQSEAWLRMMFFDKKKTPEEIAEIAKCSPNSVRSNLKKFGLIK